MECNWMGFGATCRDIKPFLKIGSENDHDSGN